MSLMMAGGEASLTQGPSKRYPTKRKAAKGPASGRTPRPRAAGVKSSEEPETVAAAAVGELKNRLSKEDIDWILSQKPTAPPGRYAALKKSNPELTPRPGEEADEDKMRLYRLVKAFYEMEERLPRQQVWMRGELERKGYVELDDETVRRRAEIQALIDREWPEIEAMMKALVVSEKEYRRSQGCDVSDDSDEGEGGGGGDETEKSDSDEGEGCGESDED